MNDYPQLSLWYHVPHHNDVIKKHRPEQLSIFSSMESADIYQKLRDNAYMSKFDLKMTYELNSDAIMSYFCREYLDEIRAAELVPFEKKLDAVVFLASNCNDQSGRKSIVQKLMELGVPVHARGNCLKNMEISPRSIPNVKIMRNYKFCITMENSRAQDYVSEKLFEAMKAGCLPIYYGAPNIEDFIPLSSSIIDYQKLGSRRENQPVDAQQDCLWTSFPIQENASERFGIAIFAYSQSRRQHLR